METIFDFNITPEENRTLFGGFDKDWYLNYITNSPDTAKHDIAKLFFYRNEEQKALTYIDQITDPMFRFSILNNHFHS